jgi:hypothetical protein
MLLFIPVPGTFGVSIAIYLRRTLVTFPLPLASRALIEFAAFFARDDQVCPETC